MFSKIGRSVPGYLRSRQRSRADLRVSGCESRRISRLHNATVFVSGFVSQQQPKCPLRGVRISSYVFSTMAVQLRRFSADSGKPV